MNAFDELVDIVARLRGEGGCPWDRAQTPASLQPYVLEEVHELLEAIDRDDAAEQRKELGDVLFQVLLLARMADEAGRFTLDEVIRGVTSKMVSRHPHVFDPAHDPEAPSVGLAAWEQRKAKERAAHSSALDGVPSALPALLRAHRITEKAGAVGFDWPDRSGVRAKVDEELAELDEALALGHADAIGEEFGDLVFTLVNLGRHLPIDAETALRRATAKFEGRFRRLEAEMHRRGLAPHGAPPELLDEVWRLVKSEEGPR